MRMNNRAVRQITRDDALPFVEIIHYARRVPSISFAFGLIENDTIVGVCTFGKPASPSLCKGVCGIGYSCLVYELNRLVILTDTSNSASFLVGRALRLLPRPLILVSYADTGWGHIGYVYQATNWLYTGLTKERTDIRTVPGKHSRHYSKDCDYSDRQFRSAKHRYIYFVGCDNGERESLRYPVLSYPKGDSMHYDIGCPVPTDDRLCDGLSVIKKQSQNSY